MAKASLSPKQAINMTVFRPLHRSLLRKRCQRCNKLGVHGYFGVSLPTPAEKRWLIVCPVCAEYFSTDKGMAELAYIRLVGPHITWGQVLFHIAKTNNN